MSTTTSTRTQGRVTLPGVGRDIENVLLWRDVRVSGIAFSAGSVIYFLLEWSGYSLLTLISNLLLLVLGLAFLWNNLARFTGRGSAATPARAKPVNESDVKALAEQLTVFFNKSLALGNRLISGQDVILTGQVGVALYIVSKIGKYFSSLGLLYTVFVLAFTIPKIYEYRKDDIDRAVSQVQAQSSQGYNQYLKPYVEKIPRSSASTSARPTSSTSAQPTAAGRQAGLSGDTATSQPNTAYEGQGTGRTEGYNSQGGLGTGRSEYSEGPQVPGLSSGNTGYGTGTGQHTSGAPGFGSGTGQHTSGSGFGTGQGMGTGSSYGQGTTGNQGAGFMDQVRNTASDLGAKAQDATGYGQGTSGGTSGYGQGGTGGGNYSRQGY